MRCINPGDMMIKISFGKEFGPDYFTQRLYLEEFGRNRAIYLENKKHFLFSKISSRLWRFLIGELPVNPRKG
jgi:hypothetical protein